MAALAALAAPEILTPSAKVFTLSLFPQLSVLYLMKRANDGSSRSGKRKTPRAAGRVGVSDMLRERGVPLPQASIVHHAVQKTPSGRVSFKKVAVNKLDPVLSLRVASSSVLDGFDTSSDATTTLPSPEDPYEELDRELEEGKKKPQPKRVRVDRNGKPLPSKNVSVSHGHASSL
jgi:hypothetical protein